MTITKQEKINDSERNSQNSYSAPTSRIDTHAINKTTKGGKKGSMETGTKKLSRRRRIRRIGLKAHNVKARAEGPGMLRPISVSPVWTKPHRETHLPNRVQTIQKPPESNQIKPHQRERRFPIGLPLAMPRRLYASVLYSSPTAFCPNSSTPKPLNSLTFPPPCDPIPTCAGRVSEHIPLPPRPDFFFEIHHKHRHYARSLGFGCSGGLRPPPYSPP